MTLDYRLVGRAGLNTALSLIMIVASFACGKGGHSSSFSKGEEAGTAEEVTLKYAENLTIREHAGYTEVEVRNPWDTVNILQRYLLIDKDSEVPANLPKGAVIKIPITNALIYSKVHSGFITEMGAIDAIGGICNAKYINHTRLKESLASGKIVDCGVSLNPDLEKIIKLNPQVIMLSPFENNDKYAKVGELGIPIVECADYMETSALGRAEWSKFYALLFGKGEVADSIFAECEANYNKLKDLATTSTYKPKVIIDQRYGQVWNVPGGDSTIGRLIEDAGGENPFAHYRQSGSVPLALERVLAEASDADIWFIRYNQEKDKTMKELAHDAPVNSQFKAYKEGNVYGCNTHYIDFYEETPFHPDRVLEDMIILMHPELEIERKWTGYYKKMN